MTYPNSRVLPTPAEIGMWRHVSWAEAVCIYARRNGMTVSKPRVREYVTRVFREENKNIECQCGPRCVHRPTRTP